VGLREFKIFNIKAAKRHFDKFHKHEKTQEEVAEGYSLKEPIPASEPDSTIRYPNMTKRQQNEEPSVTFSPIREGHSKVLIKTEHMQPNFADYDATTREYFNHEYQHGKGLQFLRRKAHWGEGEAYLDLLDLNNCLTDFSIAKLCFSTGSNHIINLAYVFSYLSDNWS
jgi:hypothetical protein